MSTNEWRVLAFIVIIVIEVIGIANLAIVSYRGWWK